MAGSRGLEHFWPFPGLPARSCPFGHTTLKSHRFVMTFEPGRRMRDNGVTLTLLGLFLWIVCVYGRKQMRPTKPLL